MAFLPDEPVLGFDEQVIVVHDTGNLDQPFHENLFQLDKKSEPGNAGDDPVKGFTDFIHHELGSAQVDHFPFYGHSLDFHLSGLF